jgi:hypothetical protein
MRSKNSRPLKRGHACATGAGSCHSAVNIGIRP